ncbi:MAG: hypothetical protein IJ334_06810, partial [Clostridia bacterium]|nr:hypothetical protein [Clostridia bacterium]
MKKKTKNRLLTAILLSALLLTGCGGREPAEVSETAGVSRELPETNAGGPPAETESTDTPSDETASDAQPSAGTVTSGERFRNGKYCDFLDGKYIYSLPARDDSGLATLSELKSIWGLHFPDRTRDTGDWYTGKLTRDL